MIGQLFRTMMRGGRPSLDSMLDRADRHLDNFGALVPPAPTSKPRTPFDTDLPREQMSMANLSPQQRLRFLRVGLPLMRNMLRSAGMYDGRFRPTRSEVAPEFLAGVERMAREAGASDIAYVEVPNNAIFRDKGIPHGHAIVFTVEMEAEPIATSPSFESQLEVARGYGNLARIGNRLARHLQRHGYAAYPGTALGGITDYPHLAELAGLGAIGYHGLLIAPEGGARLRINTIYTNITNLPTSRSDEHAWVRDFCSMCRKCIRSCPVDAIFDQPKPRGDGGMQCIDHGACRDYFTANYGCAVCLAVCPFSQAGYGKVKARFKGNDDAPRFEIPVAS